MMARKEVEINNQTDLFPTVSTALTSEWYVNKNYDNTVFTLSIFLIAFSILDGILTGIGVANFGIESEKNSIIRNLMYAVGFIPAIVYCKTLAIIFIATIYSNTKRYLWLRHVLVSLVTFYTFMAIIPWIVCLIKF